MCHLFFCIGIFCVFFRQKKNNLLKNRKSHTSTSFAKIMSSENRKKENLHVLLTKKEALPFQPMVKVLKIKADLWRIKKITLLNIKPYNLCKNSMWPTKAYIYLYIVHLKRIYNWYSQTKGNKRSSKQDIMCNTAVPSLWANHTSASSSEGKPEGRFIARNLHWNLTHTFSYSASSYRRNLTIGNLSSALVVTL